MRRIGRREVTIVDFRSVRNEFEDRVDLKFFSDFLLEFQIGRLKQVKTLQLRDVKRLSLLKFLILRC